MYLFSGFQDGLKLISLVETLTEKKVKKVNAKAKNEQQKTENIQNALDLAQSAGVSLNGVSAASFGSAFSATEVSTFISRLALATRVPAESELLGFINSAGFGGAVTDFTRSWTDGRAVCRLVNACSPGALSASQVDQQTSPLARCELACSTAQSVLGVSTSLTPEQIIEVATSDDADSAKLAIMLLCVQLRSAHQQNALQVKSVEKADGNVKITLAVPASLNNISKVELASQSSSNSVIAASYDAKDGVAIASIPASSPKDVYTIRAICNDAPVAQAPTVDLIQVLEGPLSESAKLLKAARAGDVKAAKQLRLRQDDEKFEADRKALEAERKRRTQEFQNVCVL